MADGHVVLVVGEMVVVGQVLGEAELWVVNGVEVALGVRRSLSCLEVSTPRKRDLCLGQTVCMDLGPISGTDKPLSLTFQPAGTRGRQLLQSGR